MNKCEVNGVYFVVHLMGCCKTRWPEGFYVSLWIVSEGICQCCVQLLSVTNNQIGVLVVVAHDSSTLLAER